MVKKTLNKCERVYEVWNVGHYIFVILMTWRFYLRNIIFVDVDTHWELLTLNVRHIWIYKIVVKTP